MDNILQVDNLYKSFDDKAVLNDICLSIRTGEIFGLLGPSGSGKTTLINILTGQIKKDGGDITYFGANRNRFASDVYRSMGLALDVSSLYDRLTCYQNLSIYAEIFNVEKQRILTALEYVNLINDAKTRVSKLSKGMRQRLLIARAILHEPKIIFLDEPTSDLDPLNTLEIHKLILSLQQQGTAIFMTTHKMDEAMKLCNNIALLNNSVIAEYGNPSEICQKYNLENKLRVVLHNGEIVELNNDAESMKIISEYYANDQIRAVHSSESDLEEVFLSVVKKGKSNEI